MGDVLAWIQGSALGHFMRESGPWTYAIVNVAHLVGIAMLFGAVAIIDLRLMGARRRVPVSAVADTAAPAAATGFCIAALSGAGLLASNATEYAGNPFLLIKFVAIPVALANAVAVRRSAAWKARDSGAPSPTHQRQLATMGAVSLVSWLTALVAGRMIAYW